MKNNKQSNKPNKKQTSRFFWSLCLCYDKSDESEIETQESKEFKDRDLTLYQNQLQNKSKKKSGKKSLIDTQVNQINKSQSLNYNVKLNSSGNFFLIILNTQKRFLVHDRNFVKELMYDMQIVPEQVAKYIAYRCKTTGIILETHSSYNEYSIQVQTIVYISYDQFQNECSLVIGYNEEISQVNMGTKNIEIYKCQEKIQQIYGNIVYQRTDKFKADIVFINQIQQFNYYALKETVQKCLKVSNNLVFMFPITFEIENLINIFSSLGENHPLERVSLEIEQIIVNDILEYQLIFYGSLANIDQLDEIVCMAKGLLLDGSTYEELNLENSIYDIVKLIIEQIGKYEFIKLYTEVLQDCKQNECLIKGFINFMISKQIISKEIIEHLCEHSQFQLNVQQQEKYNCLQCSVLDQKIKGGKLYEKQKVERFQQNESQNDASSRFGNFNVKIQQQQQQQQMQMADSYNLSYGYTSNSINTYIKNDKILDLENISTNQIRVTDKSCSNYSNLYY